MISPPTVLLSPCQVLTTEQADSRVQTVIDLYREREETSWTLPTNHRRQTNDAFEVLRRCVGVVEGMLIKICMFFDDTVLHNVVAIVVCAHTQRELYAVSYPNEASTQYIMLHTVMEDMTRYLDSVVTKLDDALVWLQSVEGKDHIRTSNETIRDMHLSLRRFSCRKVCAPDAAPSAPFPVPEFGGHMMPILPDCRGLCEPYFGIKGWPQNFEHMHSIDLNALPDWTLRDRNWVPMSVPLEEYIVQRRELRRQRDATQKCTTSPLQRFLVSTSRDSPIDIPPTSCRRPPVAPTSTDTGYVSGPPGTLLDDTDTSRSASTSDSKKRRRLVDDPAGSSLSEAGATVSESPRDTKRIRRHYSWPNDIPPPPRRTIRRRFTTPAPLSVTCVSPSADEAMDVDRESPDALSGPTQFGPPGLDDSSGDGSSISASDVLDETEVAQRDTSAERHDTPRWHGATAATDKPTDHHGPGPSTWLRKLWRIFGWRG